ncbi:MAG: hypothetical protein EOO99_07070 [Pedobacter sp.]|nr:MAG: hypothetical protein EOO99_07070 [Pedobacter sp.]
MSLKRITIIVFIFIGFQSLGLAQDLRSNINANRRQQDSLRKVVDGAKDSIVITAKYIRYTTLKLTKDSIQTLPLDTSLVNFENYSVVYQPRYPTVNTGNLGLAARSMLFEANRKIGFDAGWNSMDLYALNHDEIRYYTARSPFSSLYYVSAGEKEQVFKVILSQNIKPNWNIGVNYNRIGANGFYRRQRGDHLNGAFFTWYESKNHRYNLWANAIFNTLKAQENGSLLNRDIFVPGTPQLVNKNAEAVRLNNSRQLWRKNTFMLKQSYFVGRIDTTNQTSSQRILPTNKVTHTLTYNNEHYGFFKDEVDEFGIFPETPFYSPTYTRDSTHVGHLQNEFIYSFFLRAKNSSVIKNEFKINAGIKHDLYNWKQRSFLNQEEVANLNSRNFQNITLLGEVSYRFSDRMNINFEAHQIFQGEHIGDFLYEAKSHILLGNRIGQIELGTYWVNKSPAEIFNKYQGNHYNWDLRSELDRTKTVNLNFKYLNPKFKFEVGAEYFLINNHLLFVGGEKNAIIPTQLGSAVNLLKVTLAKQFDLGTFRIRTFGVFQQSDRLSVLRTPEIYAFGSFSKELLILKLFRTEFGFDVRWNSKYEALSYNPAVSQFYNGTPIRFGNKPLVDVWLKAGLKRANVFARYDFVNQGLLSNGYYTVNDYPMPLRLLKLGLIWNFYD